MAKILHLSVSVWAAVYVRPVRKKNKEKNSAPWKCLPRVTSGWPRPIVKVTGEFEQLQSNIFQFSMWVDWAFALHSYLFLCFSCLCLKILVDYHRNSIQASQIKSSSNSIIFLLWCTLCDIFVELNWNCFQFSFIVSWCKSEWSNLCRLGRTVHCAGRPIVLTLLNVPDSASVAHWVVYVNHCCNKLSYGMHARNTTHRMP